MTYQGNLNGTKFTVTRTFNTTPNNEVKCRVDWDDGGCDFVWFDQVGTKLVSQLNDKVFVECAE